VRLFQSSIGERKTANCRKAVVAGVLDVFNGSTRTGSQLQCQKAGKRFAKTFARDEADQKHIAVHQMGRMTADKGKTSWHNY
jgi:hypothetical protein